MTRSIFAHGLLGLIACGFVALLAAPGCKATGVGDPCVPEQEYNEKFSFFNETEVNVESKSFQCQTRVCLVNHFRGRVSCPYGQDSAGKGPAGTSGGCTVPGEATPITGDPADPNKATVKAQCSDRTTDKAVYCSCRCADVNGKTDDGANYCSCPDGFTCSPLVSSIGAGDVGLTGSYCIKSGTDYNRATACVAPPCDPNNPATQCH